MRRMGIFAAIPIPALPDANKPRPRIGGASHFMAKRFIDTEFFKKPLVRGLEAPYKLLYAFIICDCDNAGIWNPDFEVAGIYIGAKVEKVKFAQFFSGKFRELPNGQYFIPGFIKHQYPGGLQINNPAHKKIIEKLSSLGLVDSELKIKDLQRPLKGSKVKVMVEVEDKVVEKEKVKEKEMVEVAEKTALTAPVEQPDHPLLSFIANLPNVSRLQPMTIIQAETILRKYPKDLVKDKLLAMENKKDLTKKYTSCYLTLNSWCKMQVEKDSGGISPTKAWLIKSQSEAEEARKFVTEHLNPYKK